MEISQYLDFDFLIRFLEGLQKFLGETSEILIHDYRKGYDHTIVYALNPAVSGRAVGGSPKGGMITQLGKDIEPIDKEAMLQYVQKSGGEIISKKGATFYAVSSSVCKLCSLLVSSSESISTVSTMMHGEYGIEDVCLSTLTLVGPTGVQGKVPMRMNKAEIEQLQKSADALKEISAQIDLN